MLGDENIAGSRHDAREHREGVGRAAGARAQASALAAETCDTAVELDVHCRAADGDCRQHREPHLHAVARERAAAVGAPVAHRREPRADRRRQRGALGRSAGSGLGEIQQLVIDVRDATSARCARSRATLRENPSQLAARAATPAAWSSTMIRLPRSCALALFWCARCRADPRHPRRSAKPRHVQAHRLRHETATGEHAGDPLPVVPRSRARAPALDARHRSTVVAPGGSRFDYYAGVRWVEPAPADVAAAPGAERSRPTVASRPWSRCRVASPSNSCSMSSCAASRPWHRATNVAPVVHVQMQVTPGRTRRASRVARFAAAEASALRPAKPQTAVMDAFDGGLAEVIEIVARVRDLARAPVSVDSPRPAEAAATALRSAQAPGTIPPRARSSSAGRSGDDARSPRDSARSAPGGAQDRMLPGGLPDHHVEEIGGR